MARSGSGTGGSAGSRQSPRNPDDEKASPSRSRQLVKKIFASAYILVAVAFYICALALLGFAGVYLWRGLAVAAQGMPARLNSILEAIGLLTIAVAALELGQTVIEEEVRREVHVSAPTRVRRFLSRFLIVVVVALSVESLITVFRLVNEDTSRLPHAAAISFGAAALLAAWGVFIKLNRSAEELEPEAMEQAKREDREVE